MINKKILAASIAATFAFNANAVIDLTKTSGATGPVTYASEVVANGTEIIQVGANTFTVPVGLNLPTIAIGAEFYIRIELGNAKWGTNPVVAADLTISTAGTKAITVAGGGAVDSDYVVFGYSNTDTATASADVLTFDSTAGTPANFKVTDKTKPVTITYKLYQHADSLAALNGGAGAVKETSLDALKFATGQDVAGSFTKTDQIAQVSEQFTEFAGGKKASLGKISLVPKADVKNATLSADVADTEVYNVSGVLTVTGDLSFGKWHVDTLATCATTPVAGTTVTVAADKASGTVPALSYAADQYLCVVVDGTEIIPRVSTAYTVSLAGALNAAVKGTLGAISYNTTAITIPYVTTYSDYNQRIYILNNSSSPAPYTTSFQTEAGTVATAGAKATGTVPAKTLLAIKASDLVSFAGTTRGAAVIEIEATPTNVEATSQTVNLSDGSTDTITLADQ